MGLSCVLDVVWPAPSVDIYTRHKNCHHMLQIWQKCWGSRSLLLFNVFIVTDRQKWSYSGHCCSCLEQLPRHICTVPASFLQLSEDSSFHLFISWPSVVPVNLTFVIIGHFNRFCYLLTYILTCIYDRLKLKKNHSVWMIRRDVK